MKCLMFRDAFTSYFRFLFEGSEGTALYTGDIRLSRSDLLRFKSLHSLDKYVQNPAQVSFTTAPYVFTLNKLQLIQWYSCKRDLVPNSIFMLWWSVSASQVL